MTRVQQFLSETAARALPRILTQISRDPGAPFYGACDRNWWHYKIRDFPSVILQQAGYALHVASDLDGQHDSSPALSNLAAAAARFWNTRALRHGAFEEYYPYEQGYPPAAFSTLAVAKLCQESVIPLDEIRPGLTIAADQLLKRFEAQAANQQIAGTAALAVIRKLDASLIEESVFQNILTKILDLQHPEGWFPEYDGPDLGYLAVSIDCLWDIHDHSGDPRILPAIRKAADYISWFALSAHGSAGMHNSRNTDYFTPYGLVRLAVEENNSQCAATVEKLFSGTAASPFHPFDAIDDRYWCHYIGHSVFRALRILEKSSMALPVSSRDTVTPAGALSGSGHVLLTTPSGASAMVSTRKGGIVSATWPDGSFASDYGWLIESGETLLVSHWWSADWKINITDHSATAEGWLVPHKEHVSAPWKHILLRIGSFFLGRRLIRVLKKLVIFKKPLRTHFFVRAVTWEGETLLVTDSVSGFSETDRITRAPRTSKRHVASADSYHPEDLALVAGVECIDDINHIDGMFKCVSRYRKTDS